MRTSRRCGSATTSRVKADTYAADMESLRGILIMLRRLGAGESGSGPRAADRGVPASWLDRGEPWLDDALRASGSVRRPASGCRPRSVTRCSQSYERWDGKGVPNGIKGERVPLAARIVCLADVVEVYHHRGGVEAARAVASESAAAASSTRSWRASSASTRPSCSRASTRTRAGATVIEAEPGLDRVVSGEELDVALEAMGDLVDLKSPHMAGHSRGVANLAAEAARVSGMPSAEQAVLRRAGFVHDLGRLGVSNAIWDKPRSAERHRARASAPASLPHRPHARGRSRRFGPCARSRRATTSGSTDPATPAGCPAPSSPTSDRILAAADAYHAMTEPRPYRSELPPETAAAELRAEVRAGRLDGDAVNAVLAAAGHRAPARREWPGGLTAREVEVLSLLARGYSNKEIAKRLFVTPKTVSSHVEHIYTKIDVSSRARATHFATQHGLVGSYEASAD